MARIRRGFVPPYAAPFAGEPPNKGGILNALRRSPLVGADLNLKRPVLAGRKVDL